MRCGEVRCSVALVLVLVQTKARLEKEGGIKKDWWAGTDVNFMGKCKIPGSCKCSVEG